MKLKLSRELDAMIAEKVMGLELFNSVSGPELKQPHNGSIMIPHYSNDIAIALMVAEKVGLFWHGFGFYLFWDSNYIDKRDAQWSAGWFEVGYEGLEARATGYSPLAPHAICLAALETVEDETL